MPVRGVQAVPIADGFAHQAELSQRGAQVLAHALTEQREAGKQRWVGRLDAGRERTEGGIAALDAERPAAGAQGGEHISARAGATGTQGQRGAQRESCGHPVLSQRLQQQRDGRPGACACADDDGPTWRPRRQGHLCPAALAGGHAHQEVAAVVLSLHPLAPGAGSEGARGADSIVGGREARLVLTLALLVDVLLGELPAVVHPVVWMGRAIGALRDRAPQGDQARLAHGALITVLVVGGSAGIGVLALQVPGWPGVAVQVALLTSSFAIRELARATLRVGKPLMLGDLEQARHWLSHIVSRDTSRLDKGEMAAAAVSTVSENLCDSVVAPLFWYVLLGLPGALAYRAANTQDAMLGYIDKYPYLGRVPARFDDGLNYVPARITALLLLLWGLASGRNGWPIWWRDHRNTPSPNGGHPMAAQAGLLGKRLVKPGVYALGDGEPPAGVDVRSAVLDALVVSFAAATLALLLGGF